MKRGRPSSYCDERADILLDGIARGVTIAQMRREGKDVPTSETARAWAKRDPWVFGKMLATAREEGFEAFARDQLGITEDTPANRQRWHRWKTKELNGTIRWSMLAKWDPLRRRKILAKLVQQPESAEGQNGRKVAAIPFRV